MNVSGNEDAAHHVKVATSREERETEGTRRLPRSATSTSEPARRSALLDAAHPSLFFGPPRTLRIGVTIGC